MTTYPLFISLRFGEAMKEATILKAALEAQGVPTFLCDVPDGDDIAKTVIRALAGCKMVVILGTATYGRDTGVGFSTFEELRFIYDEKKDIFLVKMCGRFEEVQTRFWIPKATMHFPWQPGTPLPDALVPRILKKLKSLTGISKDAPQGNPPMPAPSPSKRVFVSCCVWSLPLTRSGRAASRSRAPANAPSASSPARISQACRGSERCVSCAIAACWHPRCIAGDTQMGLQPRPSRTCRSAPVRLR
jgi:hypothetical protein